MKLTYLIKASEQLLSAVMLLYRLLYLHSKTNDELLVMLDKSNQRQHFLLREAHYTVQVLSVPPGFNQRSCAI